MNMPKEEARLLYAIRCIYEAYTPLKAEEMLAKCHQEIKEDFNLE